MKKLITLVLIPLILMLPILFFTIPTISLGTDNINMIKHFNGDEASLVQFAAKTYAHFIVPLEDNVTYPQLFYYTAGIFLIPYTLINGVNYQVIVIGLRWLNVIAALASAVFIYFLCLRFFKSIFVGILSSLLLSTIPIHLGWLTISRPHQLELFFILVVFYFCFEAVEKERIGPLIPAAVFTGLATATKFGGLFVIPVVLFTYISILLRVPPEELADSLKKKARFISICSAGLVLFVSSMPFIAVKLYFRYQDKFHILKINSINDFIHSKNFRLLLLASVLAALASCMWFLINFLAKKHLNKTNFKKYRPLFLIDKSILFLFNLLIANAGIFLLFNPTYIIFPETTVKQMGIQFAKTTMSTSFNPGITKSVFDPAAGIWFRMLFGDLVLNKWVGLLFAVYIIYEIIAFKRNREHSRKALIQRLLFWFYGGNLLLFLYFCVSHKADHYLIPIAAVMGICLSFGILRIYKSLNGRWLKSAFVIPASFIILAGFQQRLAFLSERFAIKKGYSNKDTAVLIGKWMEEKFPPGSSIWVDSNEYYLSPIFKNVKFMFWHEAIENHIGDIRQDEPDIVVITNAYDSTLQNAAKFEKAIESGIIKGFNFKKKFNYEGSYAKQGVYKQIDIFAKLAPKGGL